MEWDYVDLMLLLSSVGGAILIIMFIFSCINYLFYEEIEVRTSNKRVLINFTGKEKCHVYIENDGVITCIYNPARESH